MPQTMSEQELETWILANWNPPKTDPIDELALLEAASCLDDVWGDSDEAATIALYAGSWLFLRYRSRSLAREDAPIGSFLMWATDGHGEKRFPQHSAVFDVLRDMWTRLIFQEE